MKLVYLIEHNQRNIFLKNHTENGAERLVPDLFLFLDKASNEVKTSGLQ